MTTEQHPTLADIFPVPAEARSLERMLGTWRAAGTMTADGSALPMNGEWRFERAAAGWGIACTLQASIEGLGTYEENDLVGYDTETGIYHIYSLTNSAAVHDHVARWRTSDVMEFEFTGTQGGKSYREVGTMEIRPDGTIRMYSEDQVEGTVTSTVELQLTRS